MAMNVKQYLYTKDTDLVLDADFAAAKVFGKIKAGQQAIFWKSGLRWCVLPVANVQRIFRRREGVIRKMCCGGKSFFIERLVLILQSGEELVVHIGDDVQKEAEALFARLQELHPHIQYGKV